MSAQILELPVSKAWSEKARKAAAEARRVRARPAPRRELTGAQTTAVLGAKTAADVGAGYAGLKALERYVPARLQRGHHGKLGVLLAGASLGTAAGYGAGRYVQSLFENDDKVKKYNQDHDERGRFTGPGTSHQPTGRPVGRPNEGGEASGWAPLGRVVTGGAGDIAGTWLGANAAKAAGKYIGMGAGALLGSRLGPWGMRAGAAIGGKAGIFVGGLLGSALGDYAGQRVGSQLLGLKAESEAEAAQDAGIQMAGGWGAYGAGMGIGYLAPKLFPGSRVASKLHGLLTPGNEDKIAPLIAQNALEFGGDTAGSYYAASLRKKPDKAGDQRVKKAKDDGSLSALAAKKETYPRLFGPNAWKEVEGTPFAGYIRSKVAEYASKMDDAAEQMGVPAGAIGQTINGLQAQDGMEMQAQAGQQQMQMDRQQGMEDEKHQAEIEGIKAKTEAAKKAPFKKLFEPSLFGPPAETPTLYRVHGRVAKERPAPVANDDDVAFRLECEILKEGDLPLGRPMDRGLVYGWASIIEKDGETITDHQGDRISEDELVKAAHHYITNSRVGGVLHDEKGQHIGRAVESVVFTKDLQKHLGIDLKKTGWLLGYQVEDPRVKAMVRSGVLKSFSIGGKGKRIPVDE